MYYALKEPGHIALLALMTRVLGDRAFAQHLGASASDVAKARYDDEQMVTQIERIYAEVA